MLGQEESDGNPSGAGASATPRKTYWRSASWSERSPSKPNNPRTTQPSGKARSCLPPLQPLSISRRRVEEWPKAGSDDLGEWPHPPTPGARPGFVKPLENSISEYPPREFQLKKDKLAFFDKECSRIVDYIYLGSEAVAKNREILRKNGITHVLNCVGFVCPEFFKDDLVYKTLWLLDNESEDITSVLYDVFDYFEYVREQNGRVLVHCCQGISRSTSLVIAYLMWRNGQSYDDAFQHVKAARGVTNPNMGFACQLLQCQKRVHAVPASPNSVLRMYRMAPHSPYDPLHLVPKVLQHPSAQGLDSRGAFIVHIPSAIYVWIGINCNPVMANNARASASQVVRYERAQGSTLIVEEGKEPLGFWDALGDNLLSIDDCDQAGKVRLEVDGVGGCEGMDQVVVGSDHSVGKKIVAEYDMDYEIFHKALVGGVVPLFPLPGTGYETCLPARESGWGRIRQRFAHGFMKELVTAPQHTFGKTKSDDPSDMFMDTCKEGEQSLPFTDPSSLSPSPPCSPPNSFNCYSKSSPKSHSKSPSPLPSPSLSDSSLFTTSVSSNWSDTSSLSYQLSPREPFDVNPPPQEEKVCFPFEGFGPSLAERRGNRPPSLMLFPSVNDTPLLTRGMVRSWTFSHLTSDENMMEDSEREEFERDDYPELSKRQSPSYSDLLVVGNEIQIGIADENLGKHHMESHNLIVEDLDLVLPVLFRWPTIEKVEMPSNGVLDSKSVFLLLAPDSNAGKNKSNFLSIWVGRDAEFDEELSLIIANDATDEDKHLYWEKVGTNFLTQMMLPMDTPVQMVIEGEEPTEFLEHFHHSSSHQAEELP